MKENKKFVEYVNGPSLAEVNNTVPIPKNTSFWKNIVAFSGPGALVAVGYMDPGNWITSIGGGAQYGYLLLSVVFVSSLIAMLLQYMASKLGIVTGLDLAQATRKHTSRRVGFILWMITELAIMATDIAEVIGGAIALNLLFGLPIIWGVILTVFDVLLLLFLMKLGFRKIEAIVITLILVIMVVFVYEVAISNPVLADMLKGFVPQKEIFNRGQLTMALGIVGATVMPHNLYLHSSIAQTRSYDRKDEDDVARAVRFSTWDSNIQLTVAFIINTLLLVLGAAMFFGRGEGLGTFTSLYNALQDNKLAGAVASPVLSTLFAVALLASGQNSTITGTLSGQIVMEGFINLKVPTWARRLITRGLSVIPVLIAAIYYHGREGGLDILMIRSQVFLSIALPVSMIPLVYFTSSEQIMGKRFKNKRIIAGLGWLATIVLTILNIKLIIGMF
ncbi:MAG: Nramp family divalent metal transporter [Lactococcus chungangensis]|uniref:Divalent metal cation transporter MntH n=1 Tax=Pseudolactococcus chungangensis TaxID=451457 RepID=A0A847IZM0_9LACT|nr:Nramp family divalent metal transporter [Lactococcus chungangensis]